MAMEHATPDDKLSRRVRSMFEDVMNRRRPEALAKYMASDVIDHSPAPGQGSGLPGVRDMVKLMLKASRRLRVTVDDVIVQGDRVAVRETWHTARGVQQIAHFFRFRDGIIVEEWSMGWDDAPLDNTYR
jgi:predicted SnoaL-like aldol condensation-catalyzing enzyme